MIKTLAIILMIFLTLQIIAQGKDNSHAQFKNMESKNRIIRLHNHPIPASCKKSEVKLNDTYKKSRLEATLNQVETGLMSNAVYLADISKTRKHRTTTFFLNPNRKST